MLQTLRRVWQFSDGNMLSRRQCCQFIVKSKRTKWLLALYLRCRCNLTFPSRPTVRVEGRNLSDAKIAFNLIDLITVTAYVRVFIFKQRSSKEAALHAWISIHGIQCCSSHSWSSTRTVLFYFLESSEIYFYSVYFCSVYFYGVLPI